MRANFLVAIQLRGSSQNEIAQRTGTSPATISRIAAGLIAPTPVLRQKLSRLLHADSKWLFDDGRDLIIPAPGSSDAIVEKRVRVRRQRSQPTTAASPEARR